MAEYWEEKREKYQASDWSKQPSLFAKSIADRLPASGKLLDLGAGLGQDSVFFAERGYDVVSTDLVLNSGFSFPPAVEREFVDLRGSLPFDSEDFKVVYAHLALHYFDHETTKRLFAEISRVLKPGGYFAFLVNSVNDPEYGTGNKIEDDYFETDGTQKRYFSADSARKFADAFDVVLCDEKGETYKDNAKGVHDLVRFVGRKLT